MLRLIVCTITTRVPFFWRIIGKLRSKKTKNINIWYLFITNRVNNVEVSVVLCPTGDMIGDYMTKPLQGVMFRERRYQIMGVILAVDTGLGKVKV